MIDYEMKNKEYFELDALNSSFLKTVLRSTLHAKKQKENPKPATDAMKKGTVYHSAILEPEDFKDRFFVIPGNIKTHTIKGREIAKEYFDNIGLDMPSTVSSEPKLVKWLSKEGIEVISEQLHKEAAQIREIVMGHMEISGILNSGSPEVVVTGELMGEKCKAKLDWWTVDKRVIMDVKSCQDCSWSAFKKDIAKYNYDLSAAIYSDIVQCNTGYAPVFKWLAVETKAPHDKALWKIGPEMLKQGRARYEKAITDWALARDLGIYTGNQRGIGQEIDFQKGKRW